jgi:hypothetical protein
LRTHPPAGAIIGRVNLGCRGRRAWIATLAAAALASAGCGGSSGNATPASSNSTHTTTGGAPTSGVQTVGTETATVGGQTRKCSKTSDGGLTCPEPAATTLSAQPGTTCATQVLDAPRTLSGKIVGKKKTVAVPPQPGLEASVNDKGVAIRYQWAPDVWRKCRPLSITVVISIRLQPFARSVRDFPSHQQGIVQVPWLSSAPGPPDTARAAGSMKTGGRGAFGSVKIRKG